MKTCFTLLMLLVVVFVSAQTRVPGKMIPLKAQKLPTQTIEQKETLPDAIFGQYKISSYTIISKKNLTEKDFSLLLGTLVKIQKTALTGDEIDPLTFDIYEIEKMSSADYIFREFGLPMEAPIHNLPGICKVHKTACESYYGIIEINQNKMVIPYKGVLLFLERL
jgi:hypothetical protein